MGFRLCPVGGIVPADKLTGCCIFIHSFIHHTHCHPLRSGVCSTECVTIGVPVLHSGWLTLYLLKRLREALVLLSDLKHQLLVLAVLLLHLCHILLQSLDQVQVVVRDVVVVVLDVSERLHTCKVVE